MSVMQSANTSPNLPPIEAFHVGTHTDMRGQKFTFTRDDMVAMCNAYDPVLFAAPMVIGHPDTAAPAVGWLGKLAVNDDGVVVATDHDAVNPEFAALVGAKSFRKVSLSMFKPDATDNPKPGVWYPRHLGWLGAAQPALTGLKAVNFSGDQTGYVSFMHYDDMTLVGLLRGIKNFFLSKFSTDAVGIENALPEYQLQQLLISAAAEDAPATPGIMNYAAQQALAASQATQLKDDAMSAEQLLAAQNAAAAEKQRADEAVAKLAATEASARAVNFAADARALVAEGRLHPDEVENYVAFMAQPDDAQTVSFAAPDGTAKTFNARQFMADFVKRRAPLVEMKELAKGKAAGTTAVAFAAPADLAVSAERNDLHARATALAAENKLSYVDAVRQLEAA
jgi:hypothetical protein